MNASQGMRRVFFLTISGFCSCAFAGPIDDLAACTDKHDVSKLYHVHAMAVQAGVHGGDQQPIKDYDSAIAGINACLDDRLKPAIAAAGEQSDLRNAIKDFYVKSKAWIKVLDQRGERAAETDRDAAWTAVQMEEKLADVK